MISSSFEFYHIFMFNRNVFLLCRVQISAFLFMFFLLTCENCLYIKDIDILHSVNIKIFHLRNIKNIIECALLLIWFFACLYVLLCLKCRVPVQLSSKDSFFHFSYICFYLFENHSILIYCMHKQFCDIYIGSLESLL